MKRKSEKNQNRLSLGQELIESAKLMLAHTRGEIELPTYSYIISDAGDVKLVDSPSPDKIS